jgi:hypothetical protein
MELGATVMDSREAILGLDGYSDVLVSLSALLGAKMFEDEKDEQIQKEYEELRVQVVEKQKDASGIALAIMKELHHAGTTSDQCGKMVGVSAAIQRYVLADTQASEALNKVGRPGEPGDSSLADSIAAFRKRHGMKD